MGLNLLQICGVPAGIVYVKKRWYNPFTWTDRYIKYKNDKWVQLETLEEVGWYRCDAEQQQIGDVVVIIHEKTSHIRYKESNDTWWGINEDGDGLFLYGITNRTQLAEGGHYRYYTTSNSYLRQRVLDFYNEFMV